MDVVLIDNYDGGMENWGLIALSSLMTSASPAHLLHLVAHELTHHWIGGVASIGTWSHICLQVTTVI